MVWTGLKLKMYCIQVQVSINVATVLPLHWTTGIDLSTTPVQFALKFKAAAVDKYLQLLRDSNQHLSPPRPANESPQNRCLPVYPNSARKTLVSNCIQTCCGRMPALACFSDCQSCPGVQFRHVHIDKASITRLVRWFLCTRGPRDASSQVKHLLNLRM